MTLEPKIVKSIVLLLILLTGLQSVSSEILPLFILSTIAIPFLFVYTRDHTQWWALIPAYVMFAVIGIVLLQSWRWSEQLIAPYILTAVAFPFLIVYIKNRSRRWALIPAYVLLAVAGLVFTEGWLLPEELVGSYVLFAVSIPFLYSFSRSAHHRWALIPGAITALIGTAILLNNVGIPLFFALIIGLFTFKLIRKNLAHAIPTEKKPEKISDDIYFSFEDVQKLKESEIPG